MTQLDIVLRTCEFTQVHPDRGSRFIDCDKTMLIKKCFKSLINSITQAASLADIHLYIIDDSSSNLLLDYMHDATVNLNCNIISLSTPGYNYSALKQFEILKDHGREWVYSVEDDYLHYPEAIGQMIVMAQRFQSMTNTPNIAIRPDDDVFSYSANNSHSQRPSRILLGNDRHWRTANNTHNTLFTTVDVVKRYWEVFAALAKFYNILPINEDNSINLLWNDGVTVNGPVPLFSPIPTLALHISQGNEPMFYDYQKLWDQIEI